MNNQLLKEIRELVDANVIGEETAQQIIGYYQAKQRDKPNTLTLVLGILGVLLVSSGLLLIVAHNWDDLSRTVKTVLSFIPLLAAQGACAYTLLKQQQSRAWREGSGTALFFAIGASIALVSQVYQVSGSLSGFLLTWMLLAFPLVYLLSSSIVALLCIAGITWYACDEGYFNSNVYLPFMYVVVLLCMVPHYYMLYTAQPQSNRFNWLNWFVAVSVAIALGAFTRVPGSWYEWVMLLYCILFCIYLYLGRSALFSRKRLMANPWTVIGLSGVLAILLNLSFVNFWRGREDIEFFGLMLDPLLYLLATGLILVSALAYKEVRRHPGKLPEPAGFSFILVALLLLLPPDYRSVAAFLANIWMVIIAVYFIRKGSDRDHLGIVNLGLLIIAALAVCRFFDDTIPFIWRGIFFVITGAGFFTANYLVLRKRKQLKQ